MLVKAQNHYLGVHQNTKYIYIYIYIIEKKISKIYNVMCIAIMGLSQCDFFNIDIIRKYNKKSKQIESL